MDLAGKTAIVTGASSGIGAATVRKLREAGVRVAGGARRVERVDADLALPLDVTDEESSRRSSRRRSPGSAASTSSSTTPGLALGRAPFTDSTADDEERVLHTNVDGVLRITRLACPHIRDGGHIVFMGSIAGRQAYPNGASYVASKFAVRGFSTRCARTSSAGRSGSRRSTRVSSRRSSPSSASAATGCGRCGLRGRRAGHPGRGRRLRDVRPHAARPRESRRDRDQGARRSRPAHVSCAEATDS